MNSYLGKRLRFFRFILLSWIIFSCFFWSENSWEITSSCSCRVISWLFKSWLSCNNCAFCKAKALNPRFNRVFVSIWIQPSTTKESILDIFWGYKKFYDKIFDNRNLIFLIEFWFSFLMFCAIKSSDLTNWVSLKVLLSNAL